VISPATLATSKAHLVRDGSVSRDDGQVPARPITRIRPNDRESTTMQPLRHGDSGPAIAEIRSKLALLKLLDPRDVTDRGDQEPLEGTGAVFDAALDRAVRGFQQSRGLSVDGIVGPETYRALDEAR